MKWSIFVYANIQQNVVAADTVHSPISPISPTTPNDLQSNGPSLSSIASNNKVFSDTRASSDTIIDPMQEDAVFNMPLDSTSLQASDSPVFSANHDGQKSLPMHLPALTPNSTNHSDSQAFSEANTPEAVPTVDPTTTQSSKRQPRKLTKNRGNSDAHLDNDVKPAVAEKAEKHKGVLTKKPPQIADDKDGLVPG